MNIPTRLLASFFVAAVLGAGQPLTAVSKSKQAPPPVVPLLQGWVEAGPEAAATGKAAFTDGFPDKQWWAQFQDPHLSTYIGAAIQNNPTVNIALHRVAEARATVSQNFAKQLPSVNLNPAVYRVGLPDNAQQLIQSPLWLFNLPLQASYELDIWGRNLNRTQSAKKQLQAAEFQSRAALNSVVGEVAGAYVNLLRTDALIDSETEHLALLRRIRQLKASQQQAGLLAYDDVLRADREAAQAESNLADFRQRQAGFSHQLAILTGTPPASSHQLARARLTALQLPAQTEAGLPAALITRRPDILAQERLLESARLNVSVARKAFLPTINLGAMAGVASLNHFSKLFNWSNFFNLQSATISQPLFQGGRLRADSNYAKAQQKEQLETYRQTILNAFKEVEDSLSNLRGSQDMQTSNQRQLDLTDRELVLTQSRYRQGLSPRLDVLQAESEQVRYRQALIQNQADAAIATVSLYKALGGGF